VVDGRNLPQGNRPPRDIGSSASRLMQLIDGSHYQAKVSDQERRLIRLWIDSSANYAGTYACLGCGVYTVPLLPEVLINRCGGCHGNEGKKKRLLNEYDLPSLCNLDRPDKSLLLRAPLAKAAGGLGICEGDVFQNTGDADYQRLLAAVQVGARELAEGKRFEMPGFRPNRHYLREMQRFGFLPADLKPEDPVDYYAADQDYWKSFWWQPTPEPAGGE
jgi:hypothetical protein